MPRGDKSKYTDKQKREAEKIEEGYKKKGVSAKESERRAWATVNKQTGGGKKGGSATKKNGSDSKKSTSTKKTSGSKKSSPSKKSTSTTKKSTNK